MAGSDVELSHCGKINRAHCISVLKRLSRSVDLSAHLVLPPHTAVWFNQYAMQMELSVLIFRRGRLGYKAVTILEIRCNYWVASQKEFVKWAFEHVFVWEVNLRCGRKRKCPSAGSLVNAFCSVKDYVLVHPLRFSEKRRDETNQIKNFYLQGHNWANLMRFKLSSAERFESRSKRSAQVHFSARKQKCLNIFDKTDSQ